MSRQRRRPPLAEAAGEFALIAARLWPLYLLAGAAGMAIALIDGQPLAQAGRVALASAVAAVALMPMGWIAYEEAGHGLKRAALLFLFAVAWIGLLYAPVLAAVSWAQAG